MGGGVAVGGKLGVAVGAAVGFGVGLVVGVGAGTVVEVGAGVTVGRGTGLEVDVGTGVAGEMVAVVVASRATSWTHPANTRISPANARLSDVRTRFTGDLPGEWALLAEGQARHGYRSVTHGASKGKPTRNAQ